MLPCCKKNCIAYINVDAVRVDNQPEFIKTHVKKLPCKTQTTGEKQKKRDFHRIYHLPDYDGKLKKVCKTAFMRSVRVSSEQIHETLLDVSCPENSDPKKVHKATVNKTEKPLANPNTYMNNENTSLAETNIENTSIPLFVAAINEKIQGACEPQQIFVEELLTALPDEENKLPAGPMEPLPDLVRSSPTQQDRLQSNTNKNAVETVFASQHPMLHVDIPVPNTVSTVAHLQNAFMPTLNADTFDILQNSPETQCSDDTFQNSPYSNSQYEGQNSPGSTSDIHHNSPENGTFTLPNDTIQNSPGASNSSDNFHNSLQMHFNPQQGLSPEHGIYTETSELSMFQQIQKESVPLQEQQDVQTDNYSQQLAFSDKILSNTNTTLPQSPGMHCCQQGLSPQHELQSYLDLENSDLSMFHQQNKEFVPFQQQQNVQTLNYQQMAFSEPNMRNNRASPLQSGTYFLVSGEKKRPLAKRYEADTCDPSKRQKIDTSMAHIERVLQSNDMNHVLMNNTCITEGLFSDACSLESDELLSQAGKAAEMLESMESITEPGSHQQSKRIHLSDGSSIRLQQTELRARRMEDFVETARMTFGENGNTSDLKARVPEEDDLSNMISKLTLKEKETNGEHETVIANINRPISRSKDELYRPPSRTNWDTTMLYNARTEEVTMRPRNLLHNEINNNHRPPVSGIDTTENEEVQSEVPSSASAARRVVRGEYCSIRVRGKPIRPQPEQTEVKPHKPKKKYSRFLCCFS